jgi:hypothetical protein
MFTINGHGANDDAAIEEDWDLAEDARPAMFFYTIQYNAQPRSLGL